jgi:hypothetical protein
MHVGAISLWIDGTISGELPHPSQQNMLSLINLMRIRDSFLWYAKDNAV